MTSNTELETALKAMAATVERLSAEKRELVAALRLAEQAIDDCQTYRSHLHHTEIAAVRAAIAKAGAA